MNEKRRSWTSFFLGLAAGALLAGAGLHYYQCRAHGCPWQGRGGDRHRRMVQKFERKLGLSPEQKSKVEAILESKRKKMQELREEVGPKFKQVRESAEAEILSVLDPGQAAKYARMAAERKKRWETKFKPSE